MKDFDRESVFEAIYDHNLWGGKQSRSGTGSDDEQVVSVKKFLANILKEYNIISMLDIPCGDFYWMSDVAFPTNFQYLGADVVGKIIDANNVKYDAEFVKLDIVSDELPQSFDLIFCRDLLGHLSHRETVFAIENIKRAKPRYLIATTFPDQENNPHIRTGQWRPINLEHYGLKPALVFDEELLREDGTNIGKNLGFYIL